MDTPQVRRVSSATRPSVEPPPAIKVTVTQDDVSGHLYMLSDTGADVTIMRLDHLQRLGFSRRDLVPPPEARRYTADGSAMAPAFGSLKAEVTFAQRSTTTWTDVHDGVPIPLLSCHDCKELLIIPDQCPKPISRVIHASSVSAPCSAGRGSTATSYACWH